ncbi:unnamed protein product [Mycena citricolor]|uniref:SWIM-type domain-containing protein n=1 Tax=Mycena citricolor TaxID=2018698 RepID=A0AAD2GTW9_9AGAR|nr:unnamed protein product [Mycena citricolor]
MAPPPPARGYLLGTLSKTSEGTHDLIRHSGPVHPTTSKTAGPLAWWSSDASKDREAEGIARLGRIYAFRQTIHPGEQYEATCASSRGSLTDPSHLRYELYIHRDGHSSCTCPGFQRHGGACKHLRAFRLVINDWVAHGVTKPFYYPPDLASVRSFHSHATGSDLVNAAETVSVLQNVLALKQMAGPEISEEDEEFEVNNSEMGGEAEISKSEPVPAALGIRPSTPSSESRYGPACCWTRTQADVLLP